MKTKKLLNIKTKTVLAVAGITIGWICWSTDNICNAQTPPANNTQTTSVNLPSGAEDAVKLTHAGLSEDVILAQVKQTGASYNLTTDQIIYLSNQGVSQNVISALLQSKSEIPNAAPAAAIVNNPIPQPSANAEPPPINSGDSQATENPNSNPDNAGDNNPQPPVTFNSFHEQLSPYGNWIQTPDGPVWKPNVSMAWRPYYDGGHWVNTDAGWYWQSDYTWGDIAFHYGRWSFNSSYGWTWTPGYDFAPAWVCWRHADDDGYCGWAPLPPSAVFVDGGWMFHGARVAVDFDFGLTVGFFTFVGYDHFWEHDFRYYIVPHDRVAFIYRRSVFENHYRFDHGRFFNEGLDRDRMAHLTGREVRVESAHDIRLQEAHGHILQRQNDRETVKAGGKIDATHTMGSGHNANISRNPNINRSSTSGPQTGPQNTKSGNPVGNTPKTSQGTQSNVPLNNPTGHQSGNPNVNAPSVSGQQTGSQTNQSTQTQGNKKQKKKTN